MLLLLLLPLLSAVCAEETVVGNTTYGPVLGRTRGPIFEFLGIPFAAPPTSVALSDKAIQHHMYVREHLRFRLPRAPTPWTSPLNCTVPKQAWCVYSPAMAFVYYVNKDEQIAYKRYDV